MGKVLNVRVQTKRLKLSREHERLLKKLDAYDWILFTSKHAVEFFAEILKERKLQFPKSVRIAAVGPVTAQAIKKMNLRVHRMPTKATSRDMVHALGSIRGENILFPRSNIAPKEIVANMQKKGAKVEVIPLYTTLPVVLTKKEKDALLKGKYQAIAFKSPSGILSLLGQLTSSEKRKVSAMQALSIGPMTAKKAREAGFSKVKDLSI